MSSILHLSIVRAKGVDGEADLSCHSLESIFILQPQALTQCIIVYVLQAERGIRNMTACMKGLHTINQAKRELRASIISSSASLQLS